jgi:hypothetical protein
MYLQQIFLLMYYVGFTYSEGYNLPIWQRLWFIERTNKEIKDSQSKDGDTQSRAAHTNTPDNRALMNRSRQHVPANLRRFT